MPAPALSPLPPLVLLHGWGLGPAVWTPLTQTLTAAPSAAPWSIQTLALPGYEGSADTGDGFEATARHLLQALPPGTLLCGWSLGASLAMAMAEADRLAAPSARRMAGLVLIGATPCFMQRSDWPAAQAPAVLAGFTASVEAEAATALKRFNALVHQGDAQARRLVRAVQHDVLQSLPIPGTDALRRGLGWLRDVDLRAQLAQLNLPALVVHGTHDALAPVAAGEWLARHLPQAQWLAVPDAAHAPFLSAPGIVADSIRDFARALPPPGDRPRS